MYQKTIEFKELHFQNAKIDQPLVLCLSRHIKLTLFICTVLY